MKYIKYKYFYFIFYKIKMNIDEKILVAVVVVIILCVVAYFIFRNTLNGSYKILSEREKIFTVIKDNQVTLNERQTSNTFPFKKLEIKENGNDMYTFEIEPGVIITFYVKDKTMVIKVKFPNGEMKTETFTKISER
jgi:hypothetical protein